MEFLKKIAGYTLNAVMIFFILCIAIYTGSELNAGSNKYSIPGLFNIGFINIKHDTSPDTVKAGGMAVINMQKQINIKKMDMVFFSPNGRDIVVQRVLDINGNSLTVGNESRQTLLQADSGEIIGELLFVLPYAGDVIVFTRTGIGVVLCIAIPFIVILFYAFVMAYDRVKETSKHRKMILRKRRRRRERYLKERLFA
jgi:hypothetical protein